MDSERTKQLLEELKELYFDLYDPIGGSEVTFQALLEVLEIRIGERSGELKALDHRNEDWFMGEDMVGMMLYVDLFAGDLKALEAKIPYLKELGITYVHLMSLLKPRAGENDGGYAVEDYGDVNRRLGTLTDFTHILDAFRHAGIAVCIDYVLNHTADTHLWAKKALAGEETYQQMYEMYDTRQIPDLYDPHIPDVLPDKHPGNFTYKHEIDKWVFTSFSDFQWNLNFKNPYVFEQMIDIMLNLANMGVNIIRLDAIAFMWKEVGTTCRNLAGVHQLMKMFHLVKRIVCPSLALLGEAIVEPHEIIKYFGTDEAVECDILYNANFMVNILGAIATRDTRLLQIDNRDFIVPRTICFMNYIRCHDDIGWGFNESAIREFGWHPYDHKQFLINFYTGNYEGSFSKGESYQYNPSNHDARTNGTLASLMGLEKAIYESDSRGRDVALSRIKLVTALIFSHRGIPLLYSGDELATINDQTYKEDPHKAGDGRWVHRPFFDWDRANKRNDISTDEGAIFQFTKKIIELRKSEPLMSGKIDVQIIDVGNLHIYAFTKNHQDNKLSCLFNFSENNQVILTNTINPNHDLDELVDMITGRIIRCMDSILHMYPYECLWLK
ncbi:MAG: alpha-amylase family protein [Vallitaleaceae bacterium]|nr:alpha-amylase family protein [Vallitaleaceae bacterium]